MKTPDEIKKALRICSGKLLDYCDACNYCNWSSDCACNSRMCADALDYIQQLENHIGELTEKVTQFERERDAAVKDLNSVVASEFYDGDFCELCKYKEQNGNCYHRCIPYSEEWGWQWRGVEVE